jgi:hypothetical protein
MLLIVDALTVVYMRPYLIANGYSPADVEKVVIWYDPSAIATRNDRAADADSGFEKGAISYDTWRRTHGFSDGDAPSADESVIRMILEKGMITPELTESILNALAPDVLGKAREVQQASSVAPVPPEIAQMLGGQPPAGAAPEAAPTPPPLPTAPVTDAESIPTEPAAQDAPTAGGPAPEVEPGVPNIDDFLTASALVADAGAACPPATQDVVINLKNRKNAIDGAMYGPLNPAEPNTKYWKELASEWDVTPAEAKKQRCGNCAVFIITPEMKSCIEDGLTDNADEFDAIDSAGELGYCEAFDFKCAAGRTCRAWIAGGPVTELKEEEGK